MNEKLKQFFNKTSGRENFTLSEASKNKVKDKIFANLGVQTIEDEPVSGWKKLSNMFLKTYVLIPLVAIAFISTTTIASADALPGEPLYSVKLQVENAQILLAPTDETKFDLQVKFAQKRLIEDELLQSTDENQEEALVIDEKVKNEDKNENRISLYKKTDELKKQRQEIAQNQAKDAIKFLDEARQKLQEKGNAERAARIQEDISRYAKFRDKNKSKRESSNDDEGKVKGEKTEIKDLDN